MHASGCNSRDGASLEAASNVTTAHQKWQEFAPRACGAGGEVSRFVLGLDETMLNADMVRAPYHDTPPAKLAAPVGGRWAIDGWGEYDTPAAGTKCKGLIGGTDEFSGYGISYMSERHTTGRPSTQ